MRGCIGLAALVAACNGGGVGGGDLGGDASTAVDAAMDQNSKADLSAPASCTDRAIDGDETDVDCGGSCPACATGKMCLHAHDCATGLCVNNVCSAPPTALPMFNGPSAFTANQQPALVAVGDFNKDGKLDLAAGNRMSKDVSILLGAGDGTFGAAKNTLVNANAMFGLVAGDFTGDGASDVVVSELDTTSVNVALLLVSNGDGTMQTPVSYFSCANNGTNVCPNMFVSMYAATGDFDNDKKVDVVLSGSGFSAGSYTGSKIALLKNQGSPSMQMLGPFAATTTNGTGTSQLVTGDFDGDGNLDVGALDSNGLMQLLLGSGLNTFTTPTSVNVSSGASGTNALAAADVNGDGKLDLIGVDQKLVVLLGKGNGQFGAPITSASGASVTSLVVADFNGDGKIDLAGPSYSGASAVVFMGHGDGTFTSLNFFVGGMPGAIVAADFNGDGKPDLAVADNTAVEVLINATP